MAAPPPPLTGYVLDRGVDSLTLAPEAFRGIFISDGDAMRNALEKPMVPILNVALTGLCATPAMAGLVTSIFVGAGQKRYSDWPEKASRHITIFSELQTPPAFSQADMPAQGAARLLVTKSLHNYLVSAAGVFSEEAEHIWRPRAVGDEDDRRPLMIACDGNIPFFMAALPADEAITAQWDAIVVQVGLLAASAWDQPRSPVRKWYLKVILGNIFIVCKMGNFTEAKLESIKDQVREENNVHLDFSAEEAQQIYKGLSQMARLAGMSPTKVIREGLEMCSVEGTLRAYLTIIQAPEVGLTAVTVIGAFAREYPTSRLWKFFEIECPSEFRAWVLAARATVTNPFISFGERAETELVKSTRFPNMFYGARKALERIGGQGSITGIKSATRATKRIIIDALIQKEIDDATAGVEFDKYTFEEGENVNDTVNDMKFILQSLASQS